MDRTEERETRGWIAGLWTAIRLRVRASYACLGWRLIFILVCLLTVLLGTSGMLALRLHRQHLYSLLEANAVSLGEIILDSNHYAMLGNDQEHLAHTIRNIGSGESVLALRLLDARGEVRYSSHAEEVGLISDIEAPLCGGCHAGDVVRTPKNLQDGLKVYSLPSGEGALGLGVPVLNSPECANAACHVHSPDQLVLGMLDLELSTAPLETAMVAARRQITGFTLATVILSSLILGMLARSVVHRPVHTLLDGIRRLKGGELSYRVHRIPSGELGELASSLNEMSASLEEARIQLEEWNQHLEFKVNEKTQELEKTRDQMVFAEKMASLGKLAAIVAHEINNPLAGILVYTKLVRRRLSKVLNAENGIGEEKGIEGLDETLSTIETETSRCGDIVRNLLLFSRRAKAELKPEDLNTVLRRALKLVQHQADLNGITIVSRLDPALPEVTCDGAEVQQALLAVIMNGLEAMSDGGTLTVRTMWVGGGAEVGIEIEDTGIGIPEEIRHKIFEPFFSTKNEEKGTGLGLSVLYGIIQRHQGNIDFESRPGKGTIFKLSLPVTPSQGSSGKPMAAQERL